MSIIFTPPINLAALEKGIGCCCFGAVDKKTLRKNLNIPSKYIIDLVVALGYPEERSLIESFKDSVGYWKDGKGILHVPKRELKGVLHRNMVNK